VAIFHPHYIVSSGLDVTQAFTRLWDERVPTWTTFPWPVEFCGFIMWTRRSKPMIHCWGISFSLFTRGHNLSTRQRSKGMKARQER